MAAINEAWNVLGDPARRAEYDRALVAEMVRSPVAPPAPPPAHASVQPDDDPEPTWVDLTHSLRTFRWALTAFLVLGGTLLLLIFFLIVFPQSG